MQESYNKLKVEQDKLIEDNLIEEYNSQGLPYVLKGTESPRR